MKAWSFSWGVTTWLTDRPTKWVMNSPRNQLTDYSVGTETRGSPLLKPKLGIGYGPEPVPSSQSITARSILILTFLLHLLLLPSGRFLRSPQNSVYIPRLSLIWATCTAHLLRHYFNNIPRKLTQTMKFLTFIPEGPGSNLGRNTDYPESCHSFLKFFGVNSGIVE
jgi:hypothetical protein